TRTTTRRPDRPATEAHTRRCRGSRGSEGRDGDRATATSQVDRGRDGTSTEGSSHFTGLRRRTRSEPRWHLDAAGPPGSHRGHRAPADGDVNVAVAGRHPVAAAAQGREGEAHVAPARADLEIPHLEPLAVDAAIPDGGRQPAT